MSSAVTITVRDGPVVVRIEVHNHEAATEAFRELLHHSPRPANTAPNGRGLGVVRALASRIGLDDDASGGKVVWFEWEHPHDGDGGAAPETNGESRNRAPSGGTGFSAGPAHS